MDVPSSPGSLINDWLRPGPSVLKPSGWEVLIKTSSIPSPSPSNATAVWPLISTSSNVRRAACAASANHRIARIQTIRYQTDVVLKCLEHFIVVAPLTKNKKHRVSTPAFQQISCEAGSRVN